MIATILGVKIDPPTLEEMQEKVRQLIKKLDPSTA